MDKIKAILVANRGEIAVRIIRTAQSLQVRTVSIYTKSDALSTHVKAADETILLPGPDSTAYTDGEAILKIARKTKVDAVVPGYGFLSENAAFAKSVKEAGIGWVGPSSDAIDAFGVKHVARDLAEKAGVPIVPGSKGLVENEDAAAACANSLGFPVMLKATGGGGGIGLVTCNDEAEVRTGFQTTTSRGAAVFKNAGVFLEKFYPSARHIEIQVFGNGQGKAIHFGERECSIQRRHQKVIEECPSPFISLFPGLREALGDAAVKLAESLNYASAGTVEYLVDNEKGDAFFLEMNTRLQVEHGITELCYGVDFVKLMLKQTDAELSGKHGLDEHYLQSLKNRHGEPHGAAVECRIYAENPVRDFVPSPGLLQEVEWADKDESARFDTWVASGVSISSYYDPLIAKVMYHAVSREQAIKGMLHTLRGSIIRGPPNNLDYLAAILDTPDFGAGVTLTSFLSMLDYRPAAIDVLQPGAYTTVQDLPGRPSVGKGIPHSGPMDPVAFQIANILAGNDRKTEGLEITLGGPELRFLGPAVLSLCGAPMEANIDGQPFPMWQRVPIEAGQILKIGKTAERGCRTYLAVYGGFPSVAHYFGSKATSPIVALGGYQGRQLAPGDLLGITKDPPSDVSRQNAGLPTHLVPTYTQKSTICAMVGPHDEGYLENIDVLYETEWTVSHNANRGGVRLEGPVPKWARTDGGEGGSHPSNIVEYGYPMAGLNFTGDQSVVFPIDAPNFGGFICALVVIYADWYKVGQLRPGDSVNFKRVSLEEALQARRSVNTFLDRISAAISANDTSAFQALPPLDTLAFIKSSTPSAWGSSTIQTLPPNPTSHQPQVTYLQAGDSHIIISYGPHSATTFDLNHRVRTSALERALITTYPIPSTGLITTVSCCTTLTLTFNPLILPRHDLLKTLLHLETTLGDLSHSSIPTRTFRLPLSFSSREQDQATQRYMQTQRPHAPYLPDNLAFVARNNAFSPARLKHIYTTGTFAAVVVGFYAGNTVSLPVDPRMRMSAPKLNPSRVHTPAGTVGWGGSLCSIYPVASPGGYQMNGRTLPIFAPFNLQFAAAAGRPAEGGVNPDVQRRSEYRPWLFNPLDLIRFEEVEETELDRLLERFDAGLYDFKVEEAVFDMREHNKMLEETAAEVKEIRAAQREAQAEMMAAEKQSLERWRREQEKQKAREADAAGNEASPGGTDLETLLSQPDTVAVQAPVDGSVWKLHVRQGDVVGVSQEVAVLEAMKMEISVKSPGESGVDAQVKVERVLVRQGDTVRAGGNIAVLRPAG